MIIMHVNNEDGYWLSANNQILFCQSILFTDFNNYDQKEIVLSIHHLRVRRMTAACFQQCLFKKSCIHLKMGHIISWGKLTFGQ